MMRNGIDGRRAPHVVGTDATRTLQFPRGAHRPPRMVERLEGRVLLSASPRGNLAPLVTLGDVNNDTIPDLVTVGVDAVVGKRGEVTYVGTCDAQFGNGDGTFRQGPRTGIGALDGNPTAIAVGDLDRDGLDDLAVATDGPGGGAGGSVVLMLNNGRGGFGGGGSTPETRRTWVFPHVLESSGSIAIGDLDGDGLGDVCVGGEVRTATGMLPGGSIVSAAVSSLLGDGSVRPGAVKTFVIPHILEREGYAAGSLTTVSGVAMTSFFQTGDKPTQQIAVWDDATGGVVVLSAGGNGDPTVAAYTESVITAREAGSGLATGRMVGAGDVDGDGDADFLAVGDGKDGLVFAAGLNQGSADGRTLKFAWGAAPAPAAPSSMKAKEKGNRTKCSNNLRVFLTDVNGHRDPAAGPNVLLLEPQGQGADVYTADVGVDAAGRFVLKGGPRHNGHVTVLK